MPVVAPSRRTGRRHGFTLIEVTLTVALVAILMALAVPSYQQFSRRAHRTEAIARLMEIAACQERVHAAGGSYDTTKCLPGDSPSYAYRYEPGDADEAVYFRASALPLGAQAGDACGRLSYDSLGRREVSGAADMRQCWSGR